MTIYNARSISFLFSLVALLTFAFPGFVCAEEDPENEAPRTEDGRLIIEPSPEQVRLNEQAVEALADFNADRAVTLLEAAYELGPINIIALNLGRAYQRAGECEKAHDVLQELPNLAVIEVPPPEMIENRASEYMAEIEEFCWVDDEDDSEPTERDDELIRPGHEEPLENPYSTYGYIGLGSGAALAATSLGLHLYARSQRNLVTGPDSFDDGLNTRVTRSEALDIESRANLFDSIALGAAITGGVLIGTGIYLLLSGQDQAEPSSFALTWHPEYQGIQWSTSF